MAAAMGGARRALRSLRSSSSSSRSLFFMGSSKPFSSPPTSTFARSSRRRLPLTISRLPVELGCAQSLMPLHSITASALLTSMLSMKPGGWAWLSEGFATPL
ncbi:protein NUCLEAR FUSION DEFECTIVE 6, chloroplastic/mitochondrial-like [Ananas comosus]|uniref:Protein NUCLEAR FUSION DEFECTIVE 6, chloroplastic/mitochondrial-like n=1 Tax=Ananas comosus TaxID=4615 RepID=A0A6P5G9R3_ANACO|nr:protein NUCLEAR FUSION DEFECTIVE 6, chloroplastic/mitochondrial-like [Ananas comosus]